MSLVYQYGTPSGGETIVAASASQGDVETAIAAASVGDTVSVPSGTATWSALNLSKAITLAGAGASTNITLNQCTLAKQAAGQVRVKDFRFNRDSGLGASNLGGWVISGSHTLPIFVFENIASYSDATLYQVNTNGGLFFDSVFRSQGAPDTGAAVIVPKYFGGSFDVDPTYGSDAVNGIGVTYLEDCTVYGSEDNGDPYNNDGVSGIIDMDNASKVVIRYCDLYETTINSHGIATSGTGHRHHEIYQNNHYYRNEFVNRANGYIWLRGGSGLIYDNYFDDPDSGEWGEASIKLSIRSVDEVLQPCGYPHSQQLGWGYDEGLGQEVAEGIYWYNNTFEVGTSTTYTNPANFEDRSWGNGCTSDLWGDYIEPIWNETTKPGYSALTYPHPGR